MDVKPALNGPGELAQRTAGGNRPEGNGNNRKQGRRLAGIDRSRDSWIPTGKTLPADRDIRSVDAAAANRMPGAGAGMSRFTGVHGALR